MIEFKFLKDPKKLWPGYTREIFEKRINSLGGMKIKGYAFEIHELQGKTQSLHPFSETPIKSILGNFRGSIESVLFVIRAYHDQLRLMTKLGNIWIAYRFLISVLFFAGIVVVSGGANQSVNIFKIIAIFGSWLIFESAVLRSSTSIFKYGKIESTLGISSRVIVIGAFLYSWIELLSLTALLVIWNIFDSGQIVNIQQFSGFLFAIISLFFLGMPFSYLLANISKHYIDSRFILATILRILIFTTPVFSKFHSNFDLISLTISYSPLNLPFIFLTELPYSKTKMFISYMTACLIGYFAFSFNFKSKKKTWRIS